MATVPTRTRIAIVGHDDAVNEIVNFDHARDLVRDCKRMVDVSGRPDIQVGWTFRGGIWSPPEEQSHGDDSVAGEGDDAGGGRGGGNPNQYL